MTSRARAGEAGKIESSLIPGWSGGYSSPLGEVVDGGLVDGGGLPASGRYRNWSGLLLYEGFGAQDEACLSVLPAPG